ncbi:methyl-accepting chemotaxis protein [Desulfosporosinus meridiei]|uniref:Methyl-accepting chemotaxis protein n=1 Tax=Desulfosporosinus meridiei (strain ATCC BAA-275 / DSM 13257 / KCTC 12902 / NCIMB 13706 / S10) TaxID=768704 RepID=J7IYU8_DESMD|nr:methyl-accepting chemotaxis protein [Desulfosporosinus meridiei]AFQ45289.1 methyl-accepting chemotaxis protein [Desulfosporosinus meridiei DSM 13257]
MIKLKLKTKLLLVFSIMVFLSIATVGLNLITYKSLDSDAVFVNSAGKLRANSYRMAYLSERIIIGGIDQQTESKELLERVAFFDNLIKSLINGDEALGLKKLEQPEMLEKLQAIEGKWSNQYKTAYEMIARDGNKQGLTSIEDSVDSFVAEVDQLVGAYSALSQSKVTNAKVISELMLLITVFFGIFGVIMVRAQVIRPIERLSMEMKGISSGDGDLTTLIKIVRQDELGELILHFNNFLASIREIVIKISKSSYVLSNSMQGISGTSYELSKSTEMIANAVMEVSNGSVEQTEMIGSLNALVEQMNDDVGKVLDKAEKLLQGSASSKASAGEGNQLLELQSRDLTKVVSSLADANTSVKRLEGYSNDIKGILEIINNISSQTNLLALNAAIEAARAGESGRGFAVVAGEIRKLAEGTSQATVQISEIINNITGQTVMVRDNMAQMAESIESQSQSMDVVMSKLNEIVNKAETTYTDAKEIESINLVVKDQFGTIANSASKISEVVTNNSSNTQNVAAAVQEQTASFEEVSANMSALNDLSSDLKLVVGRFKI